ncbi:MAG TPA: TIGR03013 family XrtA/PEP-CTERM system glycosyltransferase [Thermodesulfobacteriota bacterium]|nr:TIGR03013 family XrtA/PEP-CTERM system glycosyltransferase [Thermodesulfobacteriota bacterium]
MLALLRHSARRLLFILVEDLVLFAAVLLAAGLALGIGAEGAEPVAARLARDGVVVKSFVLALLCQICLYYNDLYDFRVARDRREVRRRLVQSFGATSILAAVLYLLFPPLIIGRGVFLVALALGGAMLLAWRHLYDRMLAIEGFHERVLILGTGRIAQAIAGEVLQQPALGYRVVGYIADEPVLGPPKAGHPPVLGRERSLLEVVRRERVQRVVVALPEARGRLPIEALLACRMAGVKVEEGTSFYERVSGRILLENLKPSWLIFSDGFRQSALTAHLKRTMDLALAVAGLVLAAPLFALIALLIRCDSPGPVFLRQERVGQWGRIFTLYKFRSMRADAEADGRPVWAGENDPRVTRVGAWLRKLRLDELPQLWNVVRGDMSLVGPRPERPFFVEQLRPAIPFYDQRHTVKPGLTGWAQVRYPYGASVEDAIEKLQFDLYYIKHMSLLFDLSILIETVKVILFGRGR